MSLYFVVLLAFLPLLDAKGPNYGEPVFVTEFLKDGKPDEARAACRVPDEFKGEIKSYSGFFTVDASLNSSMFFWYFPSPNNGTTPLIVYLPGEMGSAIESIFEDNGPFYVKLKRGMKMRQAYWAQKYNVIYLDSGVGTGYSFTGSDAGYPGDFNTNARNHLESLNQLYLMFPELKQAPLYIAGERYACRQVTSLGHLIYRNKADLPLAGVMIGNGFCDPINTINNAVNYRTMGLLDKTSFQEYFKLERAMVDLIKNKKWSQAFDSYDAMVGGILTKMTSFNNLTFYDSLESLAQPTFINPYGSLTDFIKKDVFTRSVHVGLIPFNDKTKFIQKIKSDVMKSSTDLLKDIMTNYKVLFYTGVLNLDTFPFAAFAYRDKIKWCASDILGVAQMTPWKVNDQIMGSYRLASIPSCKGSVTDVLLNTAGRVVSFDNPQLSLYVVQSFISAQLTGPKTQRY